MNKICILRPTGAAVASLLTGLFVLTQGATPLRAGEEPAGLKRELEEMRKAQRELMEAQKKLLQKVDTQQKQIQQLEKEREYQKLSRRLGIEAMPIAYRAAGAGESKRAPAVETGGLTKGKSRFNLYGFVRLDFIYDDSRPSNTQTIAYARSEDPTAPASIGGVRNNDDLAIHPRLTRFGLDFNGPTVSLLGDPEITAKIEIDFYNSGLAGQSESRAALRMRHAWVRLKWNDLAVQAGQAYDIISPLYPAVNPDLVMWGAGNLGDRRPHLRVEWTPEWGPGNVILQGEIGLTGANDNFDFDPQGSTGRGFRDGETSAKPTLQMRAGYKMPLWGKNFEIGFWGHRAWEEPDSDFMIFDNATPPNLVFQGENELDSWAVGMDLQLPLYKNLLWLKGEAWWGANVDDIRGGIFQGVNATTGREIHSRGGFVELGAKLPGVDWYSMHLGYSMDDPKNRDLPLAGRDANRVLYVANRFKFYPIEFGFDYLHWRTDFIGFDKGVDNRFQLYIAYHF